MPNDVPIISFIPWLFLFAIYYASISFYFSLSYRNDYYFSLFYEGKSILFILRFRPPVPQMYFYWTLVPNNL